MAAHDHDDHLERLLDQLRGSGCRITTARRSVLAALVDAGADHLTADQLTARIHRTNPDLHVSTIYRTLDLLEEHGAVVRAGFVDGAATYHLADDRHHHAVCEGCGSTIELSDRIFAPVISRLRRDHGFVAAPRHVTIAGRCRRCASR
jgi:Fur family ferric uptake transcriptional regulator